jgi:hypothetical protein
LLRVPQIQEDASECGLNNFGWLLECLKLSYVVLAECVHCSFSLFKCRLTLGELNIVLLLQLLDVPSILLDDRTLLFNHSLLLKGDLVILLDNYGLLAGFQVFFL